MELSQIKNIAPENNLNNLMNFKSKNIDPENLSLNIDGVDYNYTEYWKAQYNGKDIEENTQNYDEQRILAFNQNNFAQLIDKTITAKRIYTQYKAIPGTTHFEAQILYLFKELYNIFGSDVFPTQKHFIDRFLYTNHFGQSLSLVKSSLEKILFLRKVSDEMKDLVEPSIEFGSYEACAEGFIEGITGALSKSTSDSQVSQMKLDALEASISELVQTMVLGAHVNSRGYMFITHDVKSLLKKFAPDFKLPDVHMPNMWTGEWADRVANKIKNAHPLIKNNIKQIPDKIIEDFVDSYVADIQVLTTIFEQFAKHKTDYFQYDECLAASLDNYAITPNTIEKLKFFLRVNMAGSGFIDNLAYKFTHDGKDYLYIRGYQIDGNNNLKEREDSGVILHNDDGEITIMSPESFRDENDGFDIDDIDFEQLFESRREEDSIKEYYDQELLDEIRTARFAGCTEQELRNVFAGNHIAQEAIDKNIQKINENPESKIALQHDFAIIILNLANEYKVDISQLNILFPFDKQCKIDGVEPNFMGDNTLPADLLGFDPFPPAFPAQDDDNPNPFPQGFPPQADDNPNPFLQGFANPVAFNRNPVVGGLAAPVVGGLAAPVVGGNSAADVINKLSSDSKKVFNCLKSAFLEEYINTHFIDKITQFKSNHTYFLKEDLAKEIAEDYHSNSLNPNHWDKFNEAILVAELATEYYDFYLV